MKKLILCSVIILCSFPVYAGDMTVDQVVSYVNPNETETVETQTESESLTESLAETEPDTENITEAIEKVSEQEVETEQETEAGSANIPNYERVTLSKGSVKISVPVFNSGDTWSSTYKWEDGEVTIEYALKKQDKKIEDYLVFSAEQYENKLKNKGFEGIENSGVLDAESGLRYLGIFCSKDGENYKIYYGGMQIGKRYFIVKIIGKGENSDIEDMVAKEFAFQKLVKYEKNQKLSVGFEIEIGGDIFTLPMSFDNIDGWEIEKETEEKEGYSSKAISKEGYKANIKTYNDALYSISIMTYNCDIEFPEVYVFDGEVGFGSSEEELVSCLEDLGLSYNKTETSNEGSQYTVEDMYNSGYTFIIMNDKVYSISLFNQGYIFEQEMLSVETESESLTEAG